MPRIRHHPQPLNPSARMQLMWLASPALPVGGFSYSEGLESAVEAGHVSNETEAAMWLKDQLLLGLARADLAVVARALSAWQRRDLPRLAELNDWIVHTRETTELRLQTEQMGRSLVEWLRNRSGDARQDQADDRLAHCAALRPAPTWPIAFALAVAQCVPDASSTNRCASDHVAREALTSFAFGWAENMVQAAIKAVPLGQSAGQRILQQLLEQIPLAIDAALALPDSQRQAFTPMLAILSSQHETQYSRLFRS